MVRPVTQSDVAVKQRRINLSAVTQTTLIQSKQGKAPTIRVKTQYDISKLMSRKIALDQFDAQQKAYQMREASAIQETIKLRLKNRVKTTEKSSFVSKEKPNFSTVQVNKPESSD